MKILHMVHIPNENKEYLSVCVFNFTMLRQTKRDEIPVQDPKRILQYHLGIQVRNMIIHCSALD